MLLLLSYDRKLIQLRKHTLLQNCICTNKTYSTDFQILILKSGSLKHIWLRLNVCGIFFFIFGDTSTSNNAPFVMDFCMV